MEKIKITLENWEHTCGDGCCYTTGITTKVNEVEVDLFSEDVATILKQVLMHLGYDVEVEEI